MSRIAAPIAERFSAKYKEDAVGCWLWQDAPDADGVWPTVPPRRTGHVSGGKPHPGEKNGRAVLTAATAAQIRERHKAGEKVRALAAAYGVSKSAIGRTLSGQRWAP